MMVKKTKRQSLISILKNKETTRNHILQSGQSVRIVQDIRLDEFSLFHVKALTFEKESPRKEALENVLSSLSIPGIQLVYFIVGNTKGVSFYFGIVKDTAYLYDLPLDVDDIGRDLLKPSIEGNFRGSNIIEEPRGGKQALLDKIKQMKRAYRLDGVPAEIEDHEGFQGVDRLVDVMMGDEFVLMVLADPLMEKEIGEIESDLYAIYDEISPLSSHSLQESSGRSTQSGTNEGWSASETKGSSEGSSVTKTGGTSKGTSWTNGKSSGSSSESSNIETNSSDSSNEGSSKSKAEGTNDGKNKSETRGKSGGSSRSDTTNSGKNESREYSDKLLKEWMQYIDEVLLKRVEYGRNKGMFNCCVYLLANQKGTLLKLGNTMKALFAGEDENKLSFKFYDIYEGGELRNIRNLQLSSVKTALTSELAQAGLLFSRNSNVKASWMSTRELSVMVGLPQKEVVGLALKEEVEFGLNVNHRALESEHELMLGHLVRSGGILHHIPIQVDKQQLNKHTFITGVTGSGKTSTCLRLLDSADMPFLVIEPAKTEYRILTQTHDDVLIFTLGDDNIAPFRMNPFECFRGENITSRVDMIKANIEAAFDMEAAIPQIIEAALYACYENYGWDINTSRNSQFEDPFAEGVFAFPTFSDLIKQTEEEVKNQGFDERLQNDYIGSIKARLQSLLVGSKGAMLNTPRSMNFLDLIERNVIIELEEIKNGNEKSLIMGFLLINLNEAIKQNYKRYKQQGQTFKHITLIEEAHRLLSRHVPGDNPSKKLGVETFADMLAEVRKYGESLVIVDQIPAKLTPEVLKNTNMKIVHKLFAEDDKQAIGNTMALNDEQKQFLSNLETGQAIISSQDFAKPLRVQIKEVEGLSTTTAALCDEASIRQTALRYYQTHYKLGLVPGLERMEKTPSIETVEEYLGINLQGVLKAWQALCGTAAIKQDNGKFQLNMRAFLSQRRLTSESKVRWMASYLKTAFYANRLETSEDEIASFIQQILMGNVDSFDRKLKANFKI